MKSIDKLHCKLPAGLSHDTWHMSNFEDDAAKGFQSLIGCEVELPQKPEAMYPFRRQKYGKCIIQPLSDRPGNNRHMLWELLQHIEHCIFANAIWQ